MNCFNDLIKLQLAMNNVKRFTSSRLVSSNYEVDHVLGFEGNTSATVDYCELSTRVFVNSFDAA